MIFRKRVPTEVAAAIPDLPADEKVVAWGLGPPRTSGEPTIVAATENALYAPGFFDRAEWQQILKASWEDPILEVVRIQDSTTKLVRLRLDESGSVPQVVNERITASIIMQRHVELVGKTGASLVARRTPGSDEVRWEVIFDQGLDASDAALRAQVDEELEWLRQSAGI